MLYTKYFSLVYLNKHIRNLQYQDVFVIQEFKLNCVVQAKNSIGRSLRDPVTKFKVEGSCREKSSNLKACLKGFSYPENTFNAHLTLREKLSLENVFPPPKQPPTKDTNSDKAS